MRSTANCNSYFWRIEKKRESMGTEGQRERERKERKKERKGNCSLVPAKWQVMWSPTQATSSAQHVIPYNTSSVIAISFSPRSAQIPYSLFLPIMLLVLTEACFHQVQELSSLCMYISGAIFISHLNEYYLLSYPPNLVFLWNRLQNKD